MKIMLTFLGFLILENSFAQCERIEKRIDKFSGDINWNTPFGEYLVLVKTYTEETDTIYTMMLNTESSHLGLGDGAYILFEDGSKISREENKVNVDAASYGYRYSSFIILTDEELTMVRNLLITDIRNYIYDASIVPSKQKKLRGYFNCLIDAD